MWFRNLYLFRFLEPFETDAATLNEGLSKLPFMGCGPLETERVGWVSPVGRNSDERVHVCGEALMICLRKQQRLLPASVIKEEVEERAAIIEAEQGRSVGRKEKRDLRDQVASELLPRAFTRSRDTYAYIDPRGGWLVVDTATAGVAETLTETLRECLGSLPIAPPQVEQAPASVLTAWVQDGQPEGSFVIEDSCELRDTGEDGGVVRCTRQDLAAEEVLAHLEAGKQVVKLGVTWNDRLSCVLGDDLVVRRLRYADEVLEAANEVDSDDPAVLFDTDFALMEGEFREFLPRLMEAFGGLAVSARASADAPTSVPMAAQPEPA